MTRIADRVIPPPPFPRRCTVERVVDGDTLHVLVDLGLDIQARMTVRLAGVDTPDLPNRAARDAATSFVRTWIEEMGPEFEIRTVRDTKGKYGRYLADLLPAEGPSLCALLLSAGHAEEYWT